MKSNKFSERVSFFFDYKEASDDKDEIIMEKHFHNLFEIYLIETGECRYFIDNKIYNIKRGDIVLIPQGVIHNTGYKNGNYSRMLINCSQKYIPASFNLYPKNGYIYRNPEVWDEIYSCFEKIMWEYKKKDNYSNDILENYTNILFLLILRNKNRYKNCDAKSSFIEEAVKYIQENCHNEITLKSLAVKYSVSPEHFSREFKKTTSFTFNEYLNLLRLKKAQGLLKTSEKAEISKVAQQCGFNDSNYFSIKFKKMFGISPKQMQLSYKLLKNR
ncbi:MAG: helix-turn-helix transcriptional regulator [Clostridia bacterium]|nr:helix-turn-helix transcriptional regulator [Clostridia bacterium]MBQ4542699.1 helix-turn-helix transcriptional regulator [Clostridia bacterium]MBQ7076028.1 helix-turn-helix transcriptional regulator [Clostridia bacterium]